MDIQGITRSRSIPIMKAKPLLHAHTELMLTVECLLGYVMHQLLLKDA